LEAINNELNIEKGEENEWILLFKKQTYFL
jgi:hypothetical protein